MISKTTLMKKTILALALVAGLTSFAGKMKADSIIYNTTFSDYWDHWQLNGLGVAVGFNSANFNNITSVTWEGQLSENSSVPIYLYSAGDSGPVNALNFLGNATLANSATIYGEQFVTFNTNISVTPNTEYYIFANPNANAGDAWWNAVFHNLTPSEYGTTGQKTYFYNGTSGQLFNTINNDEFQLQVNGTNSVPEPSTYALFGIAALALVIAYRRKVA
jgi:hypothetical protein